VVGDQFTIDTAGPTPGTVMDGSSGADINYQNSTTTISAHWSGFSDGSGSGIDHYEWKIISSTAQVILPFTSVANVTSATATGLPLVHGKTYYVIVQAVDSLGNVGNPVTSDGVKVDTVPPTVANLFVFNPAFSPNGDGNKDWTDFTAFITDTS